jgi:hypothetical protein
MASLASRLAGACAAVAAACAVFTGSASAQYGVDVSASSSDPRAGAHGDLTIKLTFQEPSHDLKDLDLHLPAGLLGNPNAADRCQPATFEAGGCPSSSRVGEVASTALVGGLLPIAVSGPIHNLAPQGGEPARLGIELSDPLGLSTPIRLQSPISVRAPGGDYGLDSIVRDVPNEVSVLGLPTEIDVLDMTMTLWGNDTPERDLSLPFIVNPTTCGPATVSVTAIAYDNEVARGSGAFDVSHCDTAPFQPTVSMSPTTFTADQPAGVAVQVAFPGGDVDGRAQSHVRSARVVTPPGFVLSAGVAADGLEGCTDAQFAPGANTDPACPALSNLGAVSFVSPLLGELTGTVYLGTPAPGAPMRLFAYARKGDVRVKLVGLTQPDPNTGQITTVFDNLPQQPFETFTLAFRGGPTAVLTTPETCGQRVVTAAIEPFARPGTTANVQSPPVTVTGCPPPTFAPDIGATINPSQAGADTRAAIFLSVPDRNQRLSSMSMKLPPGLLGRLASVPMCPVAQARAGACDPSSRVGTATTTAGTGPRPIALQGPIYLTTGFDGGIAGLAVVIDAQVGPLNLGRVVSLTKLSLSGGDLAIRADTEPLPRIIGGVPLTIRGLALTLDRDGFLINPTSCDVLPLEATFTAIGGATVSDWAPVQPTGCDRLPFRPRIEARIAGSRRLPSLRMEVTTPPGNANIRALSMTLPRELGANLQAISRACRAEQFAAGRCPDASIVGEATALSPLVPLPLRGPVRLVQSTDRQLPDLVIDLHGFTDLQLRVRNEFAQGRLRATIDGVPDVPIGSFVMTLRGNSLLQATNPDTLCDSRPRVAADVRAHSGARAQLRADAELANCAAGASRLRTTASLRGTARGRTPSLRLRVRGERMRSLRLTLPRELRLARGTRFSRGTTALHGGRVISRRERARRGALRRTDGRTVTVRTTKRFTGSLEIRLRRGALRRGPGLRAGRRVTLRVRVTHSNGRTTTARIRVRAGR